jgi:hypothetical protein
MVTAERLEYARAALTCHLPAGGLGSRTLEQWAALPGRTGDVPVRERYIKPRWDATATACARFSAPSLFKTEVT